MHLIIRQYFYFSATTSDYTINWLASQLVI